MNQIITELNVFEGDSEGLFPLQTVMNYRQIVNDPIEYKSGKIVLDGSNPNKIYIKDVNFITLMADKVFTILIHDKVVFYTKQFSFMNLDETVNIILIPRYIGKTNIKYNCGYTNTLSSDSPIYCLNIDAEFDTVLEDLIVEQRLLPDDMLFKILGRNIIKNQYDEILGSLIIDE